MKKRPELAPLLLKHLTEHSGEWVKKIDLFVVGYNFGHSPETVGRTLRALETQKKVHVDYYDGEYAKGLAQYAIEVPKKKEFYWENFERDGQIYSRKVFI